MVTNVLGRSAIPWDRAAGHHEHDPQRRFNPKSFEVAISGSGTLVCVEFTQGAEAAEFAKEFAGSISRDRPRIDRIESLKANEIRREENAPDCS